MLSSNFWIIFNLGLLALSLRKKHLFLLFTIYILCNGFSFFDRNFFYIKDFFRFRDLIFIAVIVITFLSSRPKHFNILKNSVIKRCIVLIVIFNFILAIHTYFKWDYTLNELIAVARNYPMYIIVISTIMLIKNEKKLLLVLKISQYFVIIYSILYIIQTIIGSKLQIFPYPYKFIEERILEIYSEKAFRLRAWGKFVPSYFIPLFFSLYVFIRDKKNLVFLGLCFLATILTFDRTISFASIVALPLSIYTVSLLKKRNIKSNMYLRKLAIPVVGICISLASLNIFSETLLKNVITRFSSTTSYIIERSGTYGDRIDKLDHAFKDILPNNLFLGVGLYHFNHYSDYLRQNVYPDGHIGIFYILITAGIFFWIIYFAFIIYIVIRYLKYFNQLQNSLYKSVLFMTITSTLTKLIAWHYQEFGDPIGITVFAFLIGLSELCIYYDQKHRDNESENHPSFV